MSVCGCKDKNIHFEIHVRMRMHVGAYMGMISVGVGTCMGTCVCMYVCMCTCNLLCASMFFSSVISIFALFIRLVGEVNWTRKRVKDQDISLSQKE